MGNNGELAEVTHIVAVKIKLGFFTRKISLRVRLAPELAYLLLEVRAFISWDLIGAIRDQ